MRLTCLALTITAIGLLSPAPSRAQAADNVAKVLSMQEIIDSAKDADWRLLDPAHTLYLELESGRVVIELAPDFAPRHVANIVTLAHEHYWDGLSIIRSQDNYVVQWGDPAEDGQPRKSLGSADAHLPVEFDRSSAGLAFHGLPDRDGWAPETGFSKGFPAARDSAGKTAWLTHCYGAVGAGRDVAADSSTGAELYVIIGQSPRQLDRNITLVGRVVQGMELLSVLPRGTGPLGFYEKVEQHVPIKAIRLAADVADADRSHLQVLRTDTPLFDTLVESRRNRHDEWYKRPAGHIDVCNVPLPAREAPSGSR